MIRSLSIPSLLCSTAKNLCYFSKHTLIFVAPKPPFTPRGVVGTQVRSRGAFGARSMSAPSFPAAEQVGSEKQVEQMAQLLTGVNDEHDGVIVEMTTEPLDAAVFGSVLRASISHWRQQGKRGIWIKLPIEVVNLVEPAVKEGFYFHHAEPNYLMLVYWIPETANTLPANASHRIGIVAFVMNDKKEVLVVQENSGRFRGSGVWKFPTGVVDEGEDICDAAVREVKEETGIEAKFVEILAFRQSHKAYFGKSDMFFVCYLEPKTFDIQKQDLEIEAATWMPYDEYAAQPFVQKTELVKHISNMCLEKSQGRYTGFSPIPTTTSFSSEESYLYLNKPSLHNL